MQAPIVNGGLIVVAWNPNGIRSLFEKTPHEVQRLIREHNPDIVIWNEIKGNSSMQASFDVLVNQVMPGYNWLWNHSPRAGIHGACVVVKPGIQVLSYDLGFGDGKPEVEGRLITLELADCYVVGLYGVNAGKDRLQYKLEWLSRLVHYLGVLRSKGKTIVAMGDWNVAPTDNDVYDAAKCQGCSGFLPEEKEAWKIFMTMGWVDVCRYLNPNAFKSVWTWGHRTKSKDPEKAGKMYNGWRLDHCIVDQASVESGRLNLKDPAVCQFLTLVDYKGSDHAPILFRFKLQRVNQAAVPIQAAVQDLIPTAVTTGGGRHREVPMVQVAPNPKYHLPTVVCLRRKITGEVVQGCDIYIGRRFTMGGWDLQESIWANPYKVSKADKKDPNALPNCLAQYEAYIRDRITREWATFGPYMLAMVSQGRAATLGCFCKKKGTEACHGDVIVKICSEYVATLK